MAEKIILTRAGYDKMVEELQFLKTKKRREVAEQLARARAHGDLRENAEYDAAKEAKQHLEKRIADLELRLSKAQILDTAEMDKSKAYLGATVRVKNLESGDEFCYTLVAQDEADFETGKIAVTSPLGKGLLGKEAGAEAVVNVPAGTLKLKLLEIRYE